MFSNANKIKDTIARSLIEEWEIEKLYILDISGNEKAFRVASVYNNVIWIDHHEWTVECKYKNIEITLSNDFSAASVISKKYGISDRLVEIADHLDQNTPKNEVEEGFRDLISSIRNLQNRDREKIAESLVFSMLNTDIEEIIEKNKNYIINFRNEMEKIKEKLKSEIVRKKINNINLIFIKTDKNIPVYKIQEMLEENWDILIVLYSKNYFWKIEFRSKDLNILPLAIIYGGGGHKKAAGASLYENPDINEILKLVETIYKN